MLGLIISFSFYFIFIFLGFFLKKEDAIKLRRDTLFVLCTLSILPILHSTNIFSLYIMILIQIVSYIACIKIAKTFSTKNKYYSCFFIVSVWYIVSITCSYCCYYANNGLIETTYKPNIFNFIFLFEESLKYYFRFADDFVPRTQFFIGILISSIIFESIYSTIRDVIKYKE